MLKRFLIGVLVLAALAGVLSNLLAGETVVNINTSTLKELQVIKGLGPVLSSRIVEGRPFAAVDSLINIKGIGVKTLAKIKQFVTVSDSTHIHSEE